MSDELVVPSTVLVVKVLNQCCVPFAALNVIAGSAAADLVVMAVGATGAALMVY